jgi:hypothetical protein
MSSFVKTSLYSLVISLVLYLPGYGQNNMKILALPTLTTVTPSGTTDYSTISGGHVLGNGGFPITAKGVVWGTSISPVLGIANFTNDGSGNADYTSNVTGLVDSATYYLRAYATNASGTGYQATSEMFKTRAVSPPLPSAASPVGGTSFTANWASATNAINYRLDVSARSAFDLFTLASESFENSLSLFSQTAGTGSFYSGNSASGDRPAFSPFAVAGTYAFGKTTGTVTITSSAINTLGYTDVQLKFRAAAFSIGSTGDGIDVGDPLTVEISPDGGLNYYSTLQVVGNTNSYWQYAATGLASTAYDGNNSPVIKQTGGSGNRTDDGYSTIMISDLPAVTNLKIRITLSNDGTKEHWIIDDLAVTGVQDAFVPGYHDLQVASTAKAVMGLSGNTTYYYRIRTVGTNTTSVYSTTQSVTTTNDPLTADYKTAGSGNFSNAANWLYNSTGSTYVAADVPPSSANNITILSGHTISQDADLTIGTGKTFMLTTGSTYLINAGRSFIVQGAANFNNQPVTFLSGSSITPARLGIVTGNLQNATNVTVERYIPVGKRAYRQLAPGVNSSSNIRANWQNAGIYTAGIGIHITGSAAGINGFDQTQSGAVSMFTYTAGAASFTPIAGTDGNNKLEALKAYRVFVIGDRSADLTIANNSGTGTTNIPLNNATNIRATGTLLTGAVTYNTTGATANGTTDNTITLTNSVGSFNLVANPYWSPVSFSAITKTNIANSYWVWDPSIGFRGAYVTYNGISGSSGGNATNDIQPGQSIFVQTSAANPSIVFNEVNKSSGFTNTFRLAGDAPSRVFVKLYNSTSINNGGNMQDGTVVAFRDDFANAIASEDSEKFTNSDENIGILSTNSVLAIEGRHTTTIADTVPIRIWRLFANNNYTLKLEGMDFDPSITGVLVDRLLNIQHPINLNGSIQIPFSFTTDSASYYDRFMLVFKTATVLPLNITSIRAFQQPAGITVEWRTLNENDIQHYEVERSLDGRIFAKAGTIIARGKTMYDWLDASPMHGANYYRVKAVDNRGTGTYTTIVKVNTLTTASIFTIYPNPVKGKTFTLGMEGLQKGNYNAILYNNLGQQAFSKSFSCQGGALNETIQLKQSIALGNYKLVVLSDGFVVYSTNIAIQ